MPMLHWEGCEVTLLVGTSVCIGWFRSILQEEKKCVSEKNPICAAKKYSSKSESVRATVFPRGLSP